MQTLAPMLKMEPVMKKGFATGLIQVAPSIALHPPSVRQNSPHGA